MRPIDADNLANAIRGIPYGDIPNQRLNAEDVYRAVADAPTVGGWISVQDRLPDGQYPVIVNVPPHTEDGEQYLGYIGIAYFTRSANGGMWCGTDGNIYGAIGMIPTPTHWMPLPEPPEEVIQNA